MSHFACDCSLVRIPSTQTERDDDVKRERHADRRGHASKVVLKEDTASKTASKEKTKLDMQEGDRKRRERRKEAETKGVDVEEDDRRRQRRREKDEEDDDKKLKD